MGWNRDVYNGNIQYFRIEAANSICNFEATAAGLTSRTFVAWISDASQDAKNVLPDSGGPWRLANGVLVATNKDDVLDGSIFTAINQGVDGTYYTLDKVWTGKATADVALKAAADKIRKSGLLKGTW